MEAGELGSNRGIAQSVREGEKGGALVDAVTQRRCLALALLRKRYIMFRMREPVQHRGVLRKQ